jgi:hypothetical protein
MRTVPLLLLVLGACKLDSALDPGEFAISGNLRGLWTGAQPALLRVEATGGQAFLDVPANGPFEIPGALDDTEIYTITAMPPEGHTCAVVAGGTGVVAGADVRDVEVACAGPTVTVDLSLPIEFAFDASIATQTIEVSQLAQSVAFVVGGEIDGATVAGAEVVLGEASPHQALALGVTDVAVAVTAGALSNTFTLTFDRGAAEFAQAAYAKASNTGAGDRFGTTVTVSGDLMAVGAPYEDSSAKGVDPTTPDDESAPDSGAVYVYRRSGAAWVQEAYLKASNAAANDKFGVSLSLDGDRLVVGAPLQAGSGAAYVFRRSGDRWSEEQIIKAPNAGADDLFGGTVSLFGDRVAIGAMQEDGGADGVDGNQNDESEPDAGAAYVFRRSGTVWELEAYLKAPHSRATDLFGLLALSGPRGGSGDTLAVASVLDDATQGGVVNGTGGPLGSGGTNMGAVVVFKRTGRTWVQQAFIKAPTPAVGDNFGSAVALDGNVLAISNAREDTPAGQDAGAIYTYVRTGDQWAAEARFTTSNTRAFDFAGRSLSLSGELLVVGANEDGNQGGIDAPVNELAPDAGAAYVFRHIGATWVEQARIKALDPIAGDGFAVAPDGTGPFIGHPNGVAISGDTIVVGALLEDSGATGIGGNAIDTSAPDAGAVYTFR